MDELAAVDFVPEPMDKKKPQIHASQLTMWLKCGIQFEKRYIEGKIAPPGVALIIGSATHYVVESNMSQKCMTGETLPFSQLRDIARDAINWKWKNLEILLTPEEKEQGAQNVQGQSVDMAVALSMLHATELAPKIQPISVERKWVVEIQNFPYDISGTFDLEEPGNLRDTKSAKKTPPKPVVDNSAQYTLYALAKSVIDGDLPDMYQDSLVKTKEPKVVTQKTTRDYDDIQVLMRRIEVMADSIKSGVFHPAPSDAWYCNERYCGFASKCSFYRKPKSVAVPGDIDE